MIHFAKIWAAYQLRDPARPATDEEAADAFFKVFQRRPNVKSASGSDLHVQANFVRAPPIKVIGVWDTVGALGVPGRFNTSSHEEVKFFQFYDPGLGENVENAYHALALAEQREDFLPTFMYKPPGRPNQTLKQVWFQGVHTDVGGGFPEHGLSDISLAWMVAQLLDHAKGPLLAFNMKALGEMQDRRVEWSKQTEHENGKGLMSWFVQKEQRKVGKPTLSEEYLKKVAWRKLIERGATEESIHHSVVVGGKYTKSSVQFEYLAKNDPDRLDSMWKHAESEESLLPTEKRLRWKLASPNQVPESAMPEIELCLPSLVK